MILVTAAIRGVHSDGLAAPTNSRDRCLPLFLEHDRVFEVAGTIPRVAGAGAAAVRIPSAAPGASGGTPRREATRTRCDTQGRCRPPPQTAAGLRRKGRRD